VRLNQETQETGSSQARLRMARSAAHGWLARFSPLLDAPEELFADDCRDRLSLAHDLQRESGSVVADLEGAGTQEDTELLQTLRSAADQLDELERELRERLGFLAPGDPAGRVDLDELRDRLAEAAARHEVEKVVPASATGERYRLDLRVSNGSVGGGLFMGLFGVGMLSFITVHATFLIGGMYAAFGPLALLMLGFYAIFFAAGFAMLAGAARMLARERVTAEGDHVTLHRDYRLWTTHKEFTVSRQSRAYLVDASTRSKGSDAQEIAFTDADGSEVRMGLGLARGEQARIVERLNEYFNALR
jgi:hypothetical protein